VSREDLDIFRLCDDPDTAVAHIQDVLLARSVRGVDPTGLCHVAAHKGDAR